MFSQEYGLTQAGPVLRGQRCCQVLGYFSLFICNKIIYSQPSLSNVKKFLLMYVSKSQIGSEHFVQGINRSASLGSNTVSWCMAGGVFHAQGEWLPAGLRKSKVSASSLERRHTPSPSYVAPVTAEVSSTSAKPRNQGWVKRLYISSHSKDRSVSWRLFYV